VKEIVYRIQDEYGRGPFRPGFSKQWHDQYFDVGMKPLPTWGDEFGWDLIDRKGRAGEFFGTAVRRPEKLCEWFSATERGRLELLGFAAVSMPINRVLAESENQLVFARKVALHRYIVAIPMPKPPQTVQVMK